MGGAASITQENLDRLSLKVIDGKTVKECNTCGETKELVHNFNNWSSIDGKCITMNCNECKDMRDTTKITYQTRSVTAAANVKREHSMMLQHSMNKWKEHMGNCKSTKRSYESYEPYPVSPKLYMNDFNKRQRAEYM